MTEDRPIRAATAAVNAPLEWTGELRRGEDEGTVRGWLFCAETGGRIEFTGTMTLVAGFCGIVHNAERPRVGASWLVSEASPWGDKCEPKEPDNSQVRTKAPSDARGRIVP